MVVIYCNWNTTNTFLGQCLHISPFKTLSFRPLSNCVLLCIDTWQWMNTICFHFWLFRLKKMPKRRQGQKNWRNYEKKKKRKLRCIFCLYLVLFLFLKMCWWRLSSFSWWLGFDSSFSEESFRMPFLTVWLMHLHWLSIAFMQWFNEIDL